MDISVAQNPFAVSTREPLSHRTQSGFSLIEVLVAIIILSVGMLGAVGMQATALQSNKETRYQAIATTFGRELAEKMRGEITPSPSRLLPQKILTFSMKRCLPPRPCQAVW